MVELDSIDGYPEKTHDHDGEAVVYVLRLFPDKYYVGVTKQPKHRVVQHAKSFHTSPHWVKMHPPVAIESMTAYDTRKKALKKEKEKTIELAQEHGPEKVRGATWTDPGDPPPTE